jgi:TPR repeat protein
MYWMKEAASRGNARAMADVGAMYEQGKGVNRTGFAGGCLV